MKQYKINEVHVSIEVSTDYGVQSRGSYFKTIEEAKAWLDDQIQDFDEMDMVSDECVCKKCGEQVRCEHKEEESHNQSICGVCAG